MRLWGEALLDDSSVTLSQVYFRTSTITALRKPRLLPNAADETLKSNLLRMWNGQVSAGSETATKLARYGILNRDARWTCDFVARFYFTQIFHTGNALWSDFNIHNIPSPVTLLAKGLQEFNWASLKSSAGSSRSGFPIEDIWQAIFYSAIGHFLPKSVTFCKEEVQGIDDQVGFVLRNGSTRAIEFLIKSDRVVKHHERFESGPCRSLNSSYIVVDISPWNKTPSLHSVADDERLRVATALFEKTLNKDRWHNHAVFLVADDCQSGILYVYDTLDGVHELLRSPNDTMEV